MLPNIGITEGLILAFIVLLLFGARRLPEIGASLGKGIREFRTSVKEVTSDVSTIRAEIEDTGSEPARQGETSRPDEHAARQQGEAAKDERDDS